MVIACTGSTGRVGRLLVKQGVVPLVVDVTDRKTIERSLDTVSPTVVFHLAGISNVDYCEQPEHWDEVRKVNFNGTVNMVHACDDRNIRMVYLSSEHVFRGRSFLQGPYREYEPVNRVGVNNYALTKIACEALRHAHSNMTVIRTSHLFDWARLMTDDIPTQGHYQFPTFIHRSYIYLPHFINQLTHYANNIGGMPKVLHLAGTKVVSQYQFMHEFVRYFHVQGVSIEKRTYEWHDGERGAVVARRPHRAGLSVQLARVLGFPSYSYEDGFAQMEKDNVRG